MKEIRNLAEVNQKILAEGEFPKVTLRNGVQAQTGTVATMLHNVGLYNQGERGVVEAELRAAIATLLSVGLFDLFPPEEWIQGDNPGRAFVGRAASEYIETLYRVPRPD